MPGKRLFSKPSIRMLLEEIPKDGCLLVFNALHRSWRPKVADTGVLSCHQFVINHSGEGPGPAICDLYITWRGQ